MPNQRKKTKRGISVYVPDPIKEALDEEAKKRGVTLSALVTEMYKKNLERLGYKFNAEGDKS